MRDIKFRLYFKARDVKRKATRYTHIDDVTFFRKGNIVTVVWNNDDCTSGQRQFREDKGDMLVQYTGLKDKNGKEFNISDIGMFKNGDRFVLRKEDWLEIYVDWIGEPKCEDQARDLYRIERAIIIGNAHENPELLK